MPGKDVVSFKEAMQMAEDDGLNLVAMNNNDVPVCKIMDYSKFMYERKKAQRKNQSQKKVEVKEIQLSPNIAEHDMQIKAKAASKFLSAGNRVKVSVIYKGRSIAYIDSGEKKLNTFGEMIETPHTVADKPTKNGNRVIMLIVPAK